MPTKVIESRDTKAVTQMTLDFIAQKMTYGAEFRDIKVGAYKGVAGGQVKLTYILENKQEE